MTKWSQLTSAELAEARMIWERRQDRSEHPTGSFDNAGRWYPDEDLEEQDCCSGIRSPSRAWPYTLMQHCRSREHVAHLVATSSRYREGEEYRILHRRPQGSWKWQVRGGWDTYLCLASTDVDPDGRRTEWQLIDRGCSIAIGRVGGDWDAGAVRPV